MVGTRGGPIVKQKKCSVCHETKVYAEFYDDKRNKATGKTSACKECLSQKKNRILKEENGRIIFDWTPTVRPRKKKKLRTQPGEITKKRNRERWKVLSYVIDENVWINQQPVEQEIPQLTKVYFVKIPDEEGPMIFIGLCPAEKDVEYQISMHRRLKQLEPTEIEVLGMIKMPTRRTARAFRYRVQQYMENIARSKPAEHRYCATSWKLMDLIERFKHYNLWYSREKMLRLGY